MPHALAAEEPLELDHAEHAVLMAFRALAIGRGDCPMVRRELDACCGGRAGDALAALFVLVKQLGWKGQRRLKLHLPGCQAISLDELGLLTAIAEAQDDRAAPDRVEGWLSWLMDAPAPAAMASAARLVAEALAAGGSRLAPPQLEVVSETSAVLH